METMPSAETLIFEAPTASLRDVYLGRLQRLLRLRRQHEHDLNQRGIRLLDRSIFAAYCYCRSAGVGWEARQVLHESQFDIDSAAHVPDGAEGLTKSGAEAEPADLGLDAGQPASPSSPPNSSAPPESRPHAHHPGS